MTKEQLQTIADLVAIAHDEYDGCPSYRDDLERFDRVLAEIKAEAQTAPGNAATLREALAAFVDSIQWLCDGDERGIFKKQFAPLLSEARAALAAPARNCDRFKTEVEAMEEWNKYPQSRYKGCRVCPHGDTSMVSPTHLTLAEWLFAPAKDSAQ